MNSMLRNIIKYNEHLNEDGTYDEYFIEKVNDLIEERIDGHEGGELICFQTVSFTNTDVSNLIDQLNSSHDLGTSCASIHLDYDDDNDEE